MKKKLEKLLENLENMGHLKLNEHITREAVVATILDAIKRDASFKEIIDWLLN